MAKKPKTDDESMDAPVRVQLDDAAVAERGRALAEKLGIVATLRAQKKADGEKIQTQIDGILDEAEELRLEILDGAAEKRQGDLFATDVVAGDPGAPPPTVAAAALAEIAKRADEAPGPRPRGGAMEPAPGDPEESGDDKGKPGKKGVH